MPSNLEQEISRLLTKHKCDFCSKKVVKLAGFKHQKGFPFFLQKPICKTCWEKNDNLNNSNFSSLEQLKKTNQKLQSWIKTYKESKIQPKNPPKERTTDIFDENLLLLKKQS